MFSAITGKLWEMHYDTKKLLLFFPVAVLSHFNKRFFCSFYLNSRGEGEDNPSQKGSRDLNSRNSNSFSDNDQKGKKSEGGNKNNNGSFTNYNRRQILGLLLGPAFFVIMLIIPAPDKMSIEAQRMAGVALLMATWWICESIPIPITSLIPLVLMPILGILGAKQVAVPYAGDVIFLYMGGFIIGLSMQRWNLHKRIAMNTIRLIGFSPSRIIFGFMVATAAISAFVSNSATAVMMMPIGLAVITLVIERGEMEGLDKHIDFSPENFHFGLNLMLGIAYSASVGGIATLIGTPPNAILAGFLLETFDYQISFAKWLLVGVPLVLFMIPVIWVSLIKMNPFAIKKIPGGKEIINSELKKMGSMCKGEKWTALVFTITALCWIFRKPISVTLPDPSMITDGTVAMTGALLLFLIPISLKNNLFVMDWKWALKLPWGVLILFGGGLSLAAGIKSTGLATWIGSRVQLMEHTPPIIMIIAVVTLIIFLTEMTSNTATTAMMMPILSAVALGIGQSPLLLVIPAAIVASCAFMLPVATPPNAIVYGSGYVTIPQMARNGFILNIIGIISVVILTYLFVMPVFDITINQVPAWVNITG